MKMPKWIISTAAVAILLLAGAASADDKSDWMVNRDVKHALLGKLGADALRIDVNSSGGNVNLLGTVGKRETKELASTIAKSVKGVHLVDNDLELAATVNNPSTAGAAAAEGEAEIKDAMMEATVRWALLDSLGSEAVKVGTEAASGVVTLEFEQAWSGAKRQEAVAAVKALDGVKKVVTVDKKS